MKLAERAQPSDIRCRQRGISRAEALRQALRHWLAQQQPSHSELQHGLRAEWRKR